MNEKIKICLITFLFIAANLPFNSSFSFAQNKNIDSLLILLKKDKADTSIINHSNKLCTEYINIGIYDRALRYGNAALRLGQQLLKRSGNPTELRRIKRGIAQSYGIIGNVYLNQGDYPKARDYYSKALKMDEELGNKEGIANGFGSIGITYFHQGGYPEALDYYFKSLKMAEELGSKKTQANSLGNIGIVFSDQGDYHKALYYDFKALKMKEEFGDQKGIAITLGNIGNVYYNQGDSQKALDCYFKALKMKEEFGDKYGMAIILCNIGVVYNDQKDYPKALDYYFKALKKEEELGDKKGIAITLSNIGSIYTTTGKFKKAEQYLKRSIAMDDSIGALINLVDTEKYISHLYDTTGRHKDALIHYKKAIALTDTIFSQENTKKITRKEMNFEFEKKEIELQMQRLLLNQKSAQIYILIAFSILIFIIAILVIWQLRTNSNRKTIELQQKLLRSQMNPHFIFNALQSIQNYMFENNPHNAAVYLSKFAVLMRLILENSREEYIPLQSEIKTLELYLELQKLRFENRFNYTIDVNEAIDIDFTAIPPMLAQPFIENAIEHGLAGKKDNGKINVRFNQKNKNIFFEVEDNGIGILDTSVKKQGTKNNHKSLATSITKERLDILNKSRRNKISYKIIDLSASKNGEATGTKVIFSIPFKHL